MCSGDRGELALALLKALGTKESETALLDLVRYRLDAGLGEEYSAAVVDLGESASKYLRQTDVGRLHAKCLKEVKELSAAYNKILGPLPPQDICRTPDQMRAEIFSLSAS